MYQHSRHTGYKLRMTSLPCCQNEDSVLSIMLHITTVYRSSAMTHQQLSWHGLSVSTGTQQLHSGRTVIISDTTNCSICRVVLCGYFTIHLSTSGHQSTYSKHHFNTRTSPCQGTQKDIRQRRLP